MHQRLTLLCLIIYSSLLANAQQKFTISGYVKEKGSEELLLGVNIYVPALQTGTVSNSYGFYSLTLPVDSHTVIFSYVGYQPVVKKLWLDRDYEFNISLASDVTIKEVVVKANRKQKVSETSQMSRIEIPVEQVRDIPALLGEKDVMKVIQLMPGVQTGSEGNSGLYVRGGGPDQNLIILDNATVYNAYHLFGFFSLFNGDALKSVELTKGGFPARYGGRLSSVLEMNMKEGSREKIKGEAGIGLISSRLTLEGPLANKKASFLVSGRRTYIDALIYPFLPSDAKGGYFFYDLNAKVNYDFGQKNKLYLSGYFGKDKFYAREKYEDEIYKAAIGWGNATATARWNHLFNNKLFANTSLTFSNYELFIRVEDQYDGETYVLRYGSGIRDFSLKYDLDYIPSPKHYIRTGFMTTQHRFTPSAFVEQDSQEGINVKKQKQIDGQESAVYIEDDMRLGTRFKVNAGFRFSHFVNRGKHYFNPEPRLSAAYQLRSDLSAKASFAVMNQYIHLLSNTGIGLPTDLWVPSTNRVAPQQSRQIAAGLAKDFLKQNFAITLEGYYKKSDNIIGYREGASFLIIDDPEAAKEISWEDNVTSGQGWSYGMELLVQRKKGRWSGWVGYTLSWTQLQFDELNFGEKFFARYDRRHDISVVNIFKINDKIKLSGTWVYGTGNAITLPLAEYTAITHDPRQSRERGINPFLPYGNFVSDYGDKNSFRMAPYHRMDLGIQFYKKLSWGERTFELSFYNLYNRQNPFFYFIGYSNFGNERILKQFSLFPLLPSVSWNVKF